MSYIIMLCIVLALLITDDTLTVRFKLVIYFIFLYICSNDAYICENRKKLDIIVEKLNIVIQENSGLSEEQLEESK